MQCAIAEKIKNPAAFKGDSGQNATKTANSCIATCLYYYGARYLDPRTSRWISTDPAKGEYVPGPGQSPNKLGGMGGVYNTINLHVYHYAGNNPIRLKDPDGRADKRIHYGSKEWGGTLQWARDKGFTSSQAERIAKAANGVDNIFGGKSFLPIVGNQSYHFNTNRNAKSGSSGDSRIKLAQQHLKEAIIYKNMAHLLRQNGSNDPAATAFADAFDNLALDNLGMALHPLQDVFFHIDGKVYSITVEAEINGVPMYSSLYSHVGIEGVDEPNSLNVGMAEKASKELMEMYNNGEYNENSSIWNPCTWDRFDEL
jgi:RHS repeat-associated protein